MPMVRATGGESTAAGGEPTKARTPRTAEGPAGRPGPPSYGSAVDQEPYAARTPERSVLVIDRLLEVPLHWG